MIRERSWRKLIMCRRQFDDTLKKSENEKHMGNIKEQNMTNYAIVAGTPYTLMSAINLAVNVLPRDSMKDLFVRSMNSMDEYILRLKDEKLFDHIYIFKMHKKENSISYYLHDLKQAMLPKAYLEEIIGEDFELAEKNYQYISISSGFDVEMALVRVFPKAKHIAIDDGLGSYVGDIVHDHKLSWIWRVFGRNNKKIRPEILYINNANCCKSTMCTQKKSLGRTKQSDLIIDRVFSSEDMGNYNGFEGIFLSQPLEEAGFSSDVTMMILKMLSEAVGDKIAFRRHPRDFGQYEMSIPEVKSEKLWELICRDEIDDKMCLISTCSTAQIVPKLLFGKEPKVIMTYKMYGLDQSGKLYMKCLEVEKILKEMYSSPDLIQTPHSVMELKNTLLGMMRGN